MIQNFKIILKYESNRKKIKLKIIDNACIINNSFKCYINK